MVRPQQEQQEEEEEQQEQEEEEEQEGEVHTGNHALSVNSGHCPSHPSIVSYPSEHGQNHLTVKEADALSSAKILKYEELFENSNEHFGSQACRKIHNHRSHRYLIDSLA